jgi:hypothetical protein
MSFWKDLPDGWFSETGLRKLIEVAFFTSFAPEEGRYPRCSLFWSIYTHEWFDTCKFHPEKLLDVETLRRFAPICQTKGSASIQSFVACTFGWTLHQQRRSKNQ